MASRPRFTVIDGGTSGKAYGAITDTGLVDHEGKPYLKGHGSAPTGGGDGGDGAVRRITMEQNVKGLNVAVGILIPLFAAACGFFLIRIDDRFDRADDGIKNIAEKVENLRISDVEQRADVRRILEKLDERQPALKPGQEGK